MNKLYFAGPLFCDAELRFNTSLTLEIESLGFEVFLPQRDGVEASKSPFDKMSREARREAIFTQDRDEILECDVFLFVLDGRIPDEGACVELGMAYTDKFLSKKGRVIVGLHTDKRAAFIAGKLNPMLGQCFDKIVMSTDDLLAFLGTLEQTL
ncbi:nucleoside 2-deoxyribosyltransferase domain-containing protein [Parasalinivibrio latis]|uniref:nucleoside 2-deoxyribosyltransferase n=1 Tax=Parasalinivibrio latis TaxID=2952610 RepID=UPI0030DF9C6F